MADLIISASRSSEDETMSVSFGGCSMEQAIQMACLVEQERKIAAFYNEVDQAIDDLELEFTEIR